MAVKLGLDAKLYRNTGNYASPVWVEITNVKNVTLNLETGEADVTTRANNGWRATEPTLKDASCDFEMNWDTTDAGFSAIQNAFFNKTAIELEIMDSDRTVALAEGLRATFKVSKFTKTEDLEQAQAVSVTVKPAAATNAPEWVVIAAS